MSDTASPEGVLNSKPVLTGFNRIPLHQTGLISPLVADYLAGLDSLQAFYLFDPKAVNFNRALQRKAQEPIDRDLLVQVLTKQYEGINTSELVRANIQALRDDNSFTIVTAHQPLLFLGPLYFVHKAASVIKTARTAEQQLQGMRVVPIIWLGSEDHDFKEISQANIYGKTIGWDRNPGGPVGRMDCDTIASALKQLEDLIGGSDYGKEVVALFRDAYQPGRSFSQATRYIINELFGEFGLVVMDGDDARLKRAFEPVMREELQKRMSHQLISGTNQQLSKAYPVQAEPREINLFYMLDHLRERIEFRDGMFSVKNTIFSFDEATIVNELSEHPERFSPNVILRGLYQETALPNLAFVGGPAEVSYWLEFKTLFEHFGVSLPLILLRDLVLWIDEKTSGKLEKLSITTEQLLQSEDELITTVVKKHSEVELSLDDEVKQLQEIFKGISDKVSSIDPTLVQSVAGTEQKALNFLKSIEEKMLRAQKKNSETLIGQARSVRAHVFPNGEFQERFESFVNVYTREGKGMIRDLIEVSDVFDGTLKVMH